MGPPAENDHRVNPKKKSWLPARTRCPTWIRRQRPMLMRIGSGGSRSTKAWSADIAGGSGDTFRRSRGGWRLRAGMLGVHHVRPDAGAYLRAACRASTRRHPPRTAPAGESEWRRSHFAHYLTLGHPLRRRPKQACRPPRERARAPSPRRRACVSSTPLAISPTGTAAQAAPPEQGKAVLPRYGAALAQRCCRAFGERRRRRRRRLRAAQWRRSG